MFSFPFSYHRFCTVLEDENAHVLEDGGDAPIVEDNDDGLGLDSFDLNLPLDEFGAVDFDFVQNNLGK